VESAFFAVAGSHGRTAGRKPLSSHLKSLNRTTIGAADVKGPGNTGMLLHHFFFYASYRPTGYGHLRRAAKRGVGGPFGEVHSTGSRGIIWLFTFLQSIYPDYVSRDASSGILKFEIPVELAFPMDVLVTGTGTAESQEYHLSLSSLPPVLLEIVLPPAYPLRAAPEIVSFHVSGSWIPLSRRLSEKLLGMWQPGEVILYAWVEGIRGADFLDAMGIRQDGVLRCVMRRDSGHCC
jgi:hypothetical protein